MQFQNPFTPSTLKPSSPLLSPFPCPNLRPLHFRRPLKPRKLKPVCSFPDPQLPRQNDDSSRPDFRSFAGRSKKKPGGSSGGRIEGNSEVRREAKRNARQKSKKLAESLFYRLKNPGKNYPDNFTEDELQMIGLGYDRMVRFMSGPDDPNLRHPHDWYKYGEFGPYSWRGVVVGDPVRGRFSDERVSMMRVVKTHEEWEEIEQFEMATEYGQRLDKLDKSVGLRYFWVFVRHPKWSVRELPWQQWTLVAEVAVEHGKQWLDKWALMGRFGNKTRQLITRCAAWMRPDIIYVKKPVYQCRFEPQDNFFRALLPYLDPSSEQDFVFELKNDDGSVEWCTYFGGLCKIVKANPKAFVDDVVKAYDKMSDEGKSKCLEFLLTNHPIQLLHPFTKEWKAKLEEEELGCDAPDDDDYVLRKKAGKTDIIDWIEDEGEGDDDEVVMDVEEDADDTVSGDEEEEDDGIDWESEYKKSLSSAEAMENLAKRSMQYHSKIYENQMREMGVNIKGKDAEDSEIYNTQKREMEGVNKKGKDAEDSEIYNTQKREMEGVNKKGKDAEDSEIYNTQKREMEGVNKKGKDAEDGDGREKASPEPEEWKQMGDGPWRKKMKKSSVPPELFLRAAVRLFTYRNLVKEIVLTRHAILDGDIG